MTRTTTEKTAEAKRELLEAGQGVLIRDGYAGLSMRAVAAEAGTQMSRIRYHFGSKGGMNLALFEHLNAGLNHLQAETFSDPDLPVSEKWMRACAFLEEDLSAEMSASCRN